MKIKLATTCFVIGTLLAPVAAYAADSDADRTHPLTFVKDSVITTKFCFEAEALRIQMRVAHAWAGRP